MRGDQVSDSVEGEIAEVMESWPLQLSLACQDRRVHVELLDETKVLLNDTETSPHELRPEQRVRVFGKRGQNEADTFIADRIVITGHSKQSHSA